MSGISGGRRMGAVLLAAAILLPLPAAAGGPSVSIAVSYHPNVPSARLQLRADYVAVPVTIQSDSKDPLKRIDQIENALRAISDRIKQHADLAIRHGAVSLSPREQSKSFSSYESSGGSAAQLYVLGALKPDATVFALAKRIHQVVTTVPVPDGTKVTLGNTSLGMEDPEKFRPQLLGLISKSAADARKLLGASGPVDIEGLENSVAVMQLNETEVLVFINYRARIQMKAAQ
jgi:hypothetical protein